MTIFRLLFLTDTVPRHAEWTAKGLTELREITWSHGYEHGEDGASNYSVTVTDTLTALDSVPVREEMLALVDGLIQEHLSRGQSDTSPDVLVELLKLATTLLTHGPGTHKVPR